MIVLIDIGNTLLKWGTTRDGSVARGGVVDYRQVDVVQVLFACWTALDVPEQVAVSCVSSLKVRRSIENLVARLWPQSHLVVARSSADAGGVQNAYSQPEKLGVDRWLSLIAAYHHYAGDICIVDCGTAVTLDLLSTYGRHLGGVICPGMRLMKQSLLQGTENLPLIETGAVVGISDNTVAAIHSGTVLAVCGLVEHILMQQKGVFRVVLTGGDAALIAAHLRNDVIVDFDLVLKGLAIICQTGGSR